MITVLKIPIYLSVETDSMDRAKVTKVAQSLVIPRIIQYWQNRGFVGMFDKGASLRLDAELGNNDWKLLTDVEAMVGK